MYTNTWRTVVPFVLSMMFVFVQPATSTADDEYDGPFKPTPESLKQYECPEWFRDAKFGIFIHWGPKSVTGVDTWYARHMYQQGSEAYRYHVKHFGHPSEVGYKDVIKAWKAEAFDPDRLVGLFKQAGARYVAPVAVHHDNFDLWDSKHHKWNSTNYGPKKDIIGMFREATLEHGLRWGVTSHLERSFSFLQTSHGSDSKGKKKGVPYDGNNPKYQELYHEASDDWNAAHPKNPPESWRSEWKKRTKDLIKNYKPDLLYFDSAIPFLGEDRGRTGMEVIAYFYNQNMKWHDGTLEGVMTTKEYAENDHGLELEGGTTLELEKGRSNKIRSRPWQTGASVGAWYWHRNDDYRSTEEIVHELIDIVSKNGNLLLNVPPRASGRLDPPVVNILKNIGQWLDVNGQAIYATRPWQVYGEGPVARSRKNLSKHAQVPDVNYTHRDIRYTRSKDGSVLYAFMLGWPEQSTRILKKVRVQNAVDESRVTMLGHEEPLEYNVTETDRLAISLPQLSKDERPGKYAYTFKLTGFELRAGDPYDRPLSTGKPATASNVYKDQVSTYGPSKAVDGDRSTRWATDVELSDPWIQIDLQEPTTINRIRVHEAMGTWIQSHSLEYWKDGEWKTIYQGDTIGSDFERTFGPVTTSKVRLNVHDATKGPTIREIWLFGPDS